MANQLLLESRNSYKPLSLQISLKNPSAPKCLYWPSLYQKMKVSKKVEWGLNSVGAMMMSFVLMYTKFVCARIWWVTRQQLDLELHCLMGQTAEYARAELQIWKEWLADSKTSVVYSSDHCKKTWMNYSWAKGSSLDKQDSTCPGPAVLWGEVSLELLGTPGPPLPILCSVMAHSVELITVTRGLSRLWHHDLGKSQRITRQLETSRGHCAKNGQHYTLISLFSSCILGILYCYITSILWWFWAEYYHVLELYHDNKTRRFLNSTNVSNPEHRGSFCKQLESILWNIKHSSFPEVEHICVESNRTESYPFIAWLRSDAVNICSFSWSWTSQWIHRITANGQTENCISVLCLQLWKSQVFQTMLN